MMRLREHYEKKVIPQMKNRFGYTNNLAVPRLVKAVVHVGTGHAMKDDRLLETVKDTLRRITGQNPVVTRAKKSISAFKVRQGMAVGMMVTLRKQRFYDFIEKLIHVTLPRVRDFRGLPEKSVDRSGNLTIGFQEHVVFPEIKSDEVLSVHGLEVVIHTTAKTQREGLALFQYLGFPFRTQSPTKT